MVSSPGWSVAIRESPLGEDDESEVVAPVGPFIVLLGQDRSGQANERGWVGEGFDNVGAAADLAVEAVVGAFGPDLAPHGLGERGEREDVGAVLVELGWTTGRVFSI